MLTDRYISEPYSLSADSTFAIICVTAIDSSE